jgi:hypothetical protein
LIDDLAFFTGYWFAKQALLVLVAKPEKWNFFIYLFALPILLLA